MDNLGGTPSAGATQQFCLRWHNHQTSLLSSLPLLLDQSLLTDVTLSAEGRNVRAHRVVLSACSTFFADLFRTLEPPFHPVIVLPGASFGSMVSLLTFMYSGEVNVYEDQIAGLLALAETLGIKGLADFNGNAAKPLSSPKCETPASKDADSPSPPPTPTPMHHHQAHHHQHHQPSSAPHSHLPQQHAHQSQGKPSSAASHLETLFAKTFQFCPSMIANPLNFSPSAISRGAEIFARYQNQCRLNQLDKTSTESLDENGNRRATPLNVEPTTDAQRKTSSLSGNKQSPAAAESMRKIDKIAENLRSATTPSRQSAGNLTSNDANKLAMSLAQSTPASPLLLIKPSPFSSLAQFMHDNIQEGASSATPLNNSGNYNKNNSANKLSANHNTLQRATVPQSAADCLMMDTTSISSGMHTLHQPQLHQAQMMHHSTLQHHQQQQQQQQQHQQHQQAALHQHMPTAFHSSDQPSGGAGSVDGLTPEKSTQPKPSNSKLYATCFICHKQLSNQYNLRVHLETHQNVRYACEVCSHVSRSKDALRKHVSYRHPGAPSPCETEAKRKRTKAAAAAKLQHDLTLLPSTSQQYAHQMTLQQQLQSGQCFSSDPPSYPGGPPAALSAQPNTPSSMGHQADSVKSEPSIPINCTTSQTTLSTREQLSSSSSMMSTPAITAPAASDDQPQSASQMTSSSNKSASNVSQTQHNTQQLPQCQ